MLELKNIARSYGTKTVVNDISFNIKEKSIFGLLGPNGSGKTTIIRIILGLLKPDSGNIFFYSKPVTQIENDLIGYLPENISLYPDQKVLTQIIFWLKMKGIESNMAKDIALEALNELEIEQTKNKKVHELSKGQQQRISLIISLAWKPKLAIIDEPFSGLDPIGVDKVMDFIKKVNSLGTTILVSTHLLECAEKIIDNSCFINKGNKIEEGSPTELLSKYQLKDKAISFRELFTLINSKKEN